MKLFVVLFCLLLSPSVFAESLVCKVFANIQNEKGEMEQSQVWRDRGSSPMEWDLSYLNKPRVFSFSAKRENGKLTAQINYHVNSQLSAVAVSENENVTVKFEGQLLYWAESLGYEVDKGYPNIKSVELQCSVR